MIIPSSSRVFKKYKVLSKIGEGGFSQVFKVQLLNSDTSANEVYALKYFLIRPESDKEVAINRFKRGNSDFTESKIRLFSLLYWIICWWWWAICNNGIYWRQVLKRVN
nr:hypothetical protein [Mycoplasmopsis bovis]